MKNLKVRTQLVAGFLVVAIITLIVGIIGIYNLDDVDARYTVATNEYAKPLEDAAHALTGLHSMRAEIRLAMLLTGDAAKVQTQKGLIDSARDNFYTSVTAFGATLVTDEAKVAYAEAMDAYNNTLSAAIDKVVADAAAGVSQADLIAFMGTSLKPPMDLINENIQMCMITKANLLDDTAIANSKQASTSFIILLSLVAAATVVSLALGFYLANSIAKTIKVISDGIDNVADGDFTVEVLVQNRNEFGQLASQVNKMISKLREVLYRVNDVALVVDDTSRQVASSSMSLAQIATEQAGSSQEISSSMHNITERTKTNSENADKAFGFSEGTKANAVEGNKRMNEMLKAMQAINDASANISNIIKVIDDIAFQTNILALNAAVEAARAGSHGKGFAVVAEEVRTLSARSATAASETTTMIENSIKEVEHGTVIAKETAASLKEILDGVADTAELIKNISEASRLQSEEAGQISGGIEQVTQAIQTTSSVAEEAASSSSELADQSATLKELVSAFKFSLGTGAPAIARRGDRQKSIGGGQGGAPGKAAQLNELPLAAGAEGAARQQRPRQSAASAPAVIPEGDFGKY